AYSPAPILPKEKLDDYVKTTVAPVIKVLAEDGHPFVGVIYAGLMVTAKGPKVLEYNVRFGDPECQALLPRLDSDLLTVILACLHGQLTKELVRFLPKSSLGVVVAAEGYPGAYAKDLPLEGLALLEEAGLLVFHSGTTRAKDGQVVSKGGRIICVTALADDLAACRDQVYAGLSKVKFPKTFYRKDIGAKGLKRLQA
ncbi:MAG: phosphoribosylamine--glycine ligase, partial [Desulfovibrio sp.]|nr:phosphoribosylamine--glycine ligase [Desulfovibrio sp.]